MWATLAMTEDGEVDTKYSADIGKMSPVLQAMAKQVILEQCRPEMKTYLVERQCYGMSLRQVQEHGASYQVAHGRQGDTARKPVEQSVPRPTASAQCMAICCCRSLFNVAPQTGDFASFDTCGRQKE